MYLIAGLIPRVLQSADVFRFALVGERGPLQGPVLDGLGEDLHGDFFGGGVDFAV